MIYVGADMNLRSWQDYASTFFTKLLALGARFLLDIRFILSHYLIDDSILPVGIRLEYVLEQSLSMSSDINCAICSVPFYRKTPGLDLGHT